MHPKYSTTVPVFPSVPEMKADEAEIVAETWGCGAAGGWAGCRV